jgi:redox-sensitive bicupin YhaK (pirin superfamily)
LEEELNMNKQRTIRKIYPSSRVTEGAGVRLNRAFGYHQVPAFDPFLLLDDFHSQDPDDYLAGFPWHPHRGIETVTYMINGDVEHGDSMGNTGRIGSGDVQWMTAGSGIIHQEMPSRTEGMMQGFQLWVNLPAENKMMEPRYREVTASEIPQVELKTGGKARIIAGSLEGNAGPVKDIICTPEYFDITLPAGGIFVHPVPKEHTVFAYLMQGRGFFDADKNVIVDPRSTILLSSGENIHIEAKEEEIRFLLIAGAPLGEPVAWYGPIVMNTDEELKTAFEEYRNGTFLKEK